MLHSYSDEVFLCFQQLLEKDSTLSQFKSYKQGAKRIKRVGDVLTVIVVAGMHLLSFCDLRCVVIFLNFFHVLHLGNQQWLLQYCLLIDVLSYWLTMNYDKCCKL